METTKKIVKYVKDSVANISGIIAGNRAEEEINIMNHSFEWSNNNETILVKKCEFEAMQNEIFNQTEVIKRFKHKETEYQSIAQDYEDTLAMMLKKDQTGKEVEHIDIGLGKKYEDDIARLKCAEERYKSHIQALKRDLMLAEEKAENLEDAYESKTEILMKEVEELKVKSKLDI